LPVGLSTVSANQDELAERTQCASPSLLFLVEKGLFFVSVPYVLALFGVNPALNATPFPLFDPLLSNLTDLPDLADLDDFYALGQNLGILGILADLGIWGPRVPRFGETW